MCCFLSHKSIFLASLCVVLLLVGSMCCPVWKTSSGQQSSPAIRKNIYFIQFSIDCVRPWTRHTIKNVRKGSTATWTVKEAIKNIARHKLKNLTGKMSVFCALLYAPELSLKQSKKHEEKIFSTFFAHNFSDLD